MPFVQSEKLLEERIKNQEKFYNCNNWVRVFDLVWSPLPPASMKRLELYNLFLVLSSSFFLGNLPELWFKTFARKEQEKLELEKEWRRGEDEEMKSKS